MLGRDSVANCYSHGIEWGAKPCIATSLPSLAPTTPPSTSAVRMNGSCLSERLETPHFYLIFVCQTFTAALISPPELFPGTQPKS
jgi:hypothetical protein